MAITVHKLFTVADNQLTLEAALPGSFAWRLMDVCAVITNLPPAPDVEAPLKLPVTVGEGNQRETVVVPVRDFVGRAARARSMREPVSICELHSPKPDRRWLWLYRDGIWVTSRNPRQVEVAEVVLRIKAAQFKEDEELRRLREQVANLEGVETLRSGARIRVPIPDDVKLAVWSRDGGACVKCGAREHLQFDHVIPHSLGGSDAVENVQILCRACNLAKGANLT